MQRKILTKAMRFLKALAKKILFPIYFLFNLFYLPFLKTFFFSRIWKIPRTTQLFFMTRFDFGTWLLLMHYAECWAQERGDAALVIFVPNAHIPRRLASFICPHVQIIAFDNWLSRIVFAIFRRELVQFLTLNRIYAEACAQWPYALFMFDMTYSRKYQKNISSYIPAFDSALSLSNRFSREFVEAYLTIQMQNDNRPAVYQDLIRIVNARPSFPMEKKRSEGKNLYASRPYVVMNLNCKNYHNRARNVRSILHPERYNVVIDLLISKGYAVVIQGREEQPSFAPRNHLIEYCRSSHVSPENDYLLYQSCEFAILPKTGPEVFSAICDIPLLGLNYCELATINPKGRCRFYPKHVLDSNTQRVLHWKELLERPCFFNVGELSFEAGIEYREMEEEELVLAVEEFLELLSLPRSKWSEYTFLQKEFKQSLHPMHMDLYAISEVPCDCYLSSSKFKSYAAI